MTNELATMQNTSVPAYLQQKVAQSMDENAMASAGIKGGDFLPNLSIKGKCFSIRHNGETKALPVSSLDVVIIAARPTISKLKFPSGYNPKENASPVCASIDSRTADFDTDLVDPTTGKCCRNCDGCFFNQFGSSEQGAGKACKDYKRLIVMLADQQGFTGKSPAMILDVPATSLKSPKGTNMMMLKEYISALSQGGVPMSTYVATLSFVMTSEFPQLLFTPKRWVSEAELARVKELQGLESVKNALELRHVKESDEDEDEAVAQPTPAVQIEAKPAYVQATEPTATWEPGGCAEVEKPTPVKKAPAKKAKAEPEPLDIEDATAAVADKPQGQPAESADAAMMDTMAKAEALLSQFRVK